MHIELLANQTDYVHDVADMVFNEFVMNSNSKMTFSDVMTYFSNTYCEQLPITLIAEEENECIGTASIFEYDLKERETYTPWLASLYTKPNQRGKGVGQKLINETIKFAKELGYSEIYLKTENASDYYRKRGWSFVETILDHSGEEIDVFKYTISKQNKLAFK